MSLKGSIIKNKSYLISMEEFNMKKVYLVRKIKVYSEQSEQIMLRLADGTSTNPIRDRRQLSQALELVLLYSEMLKTGQYE